MKVKGIAIVLVALSLTMSALLIPSAGAQKAHPKWMYLLYLDADNSLDVYAGAHHIPVVQDDLDELMSVGSTSDVIAYVLVDRFDGPANLLKINKGSAKELTDSPLNGKELNMGDPATVRSFISYTFTATPADHALLIFWDHGSLNYAAWDDHAGEAGGGDALTHFEVIQALSGYKVDILAADECNVGQAEIAYEYALGTQTEYLVAAETYTGWRGFPYDWTLRELVNNPDMTARDAAIMMVEQTQLLLNTSPYMGERVNTHSAIDLMMVKNLVSSLKSLTDLITPKMANYANLISNARGEAQYCYGANAGNKIDLRVFVDTIATKTSSTKIREASEAVLADFDDTVIAIHATGSLDHMLYGLGITFPDHSWELPSYYMEFRLASQGWMDFVEAYWAAHGSI